MKEIHSWKNILLTIMLFIIATIPSDVFLSDTYIFKSIIAAIIAITILYTMYREKK